MSKLYKALSQLCSGESPYHHRPCHYIPRWRWQLGQSLIVHQQIRPEQLATLARWLRLRTQVNWTAKMLRQSILLAEVFAEEDICDELSFTHYSLIGRLKTAVERRFYLRASLENTWSSTQLQRQIKTRFYQRQARASPSGIMQHYLFDLTDEAIGKEAELEAQLASQLAAVLLELGAGFSWVGRQRLLRLPSGQRFYSDLVFYHCVQRFYLLVELKVSHLTHRDIGQLDTYVRLFDVCHRSAADQATVGLLLCPSYDPTLLPYTAIADNDRLFVATWSTAL